MIDVIVSGLLLLIFDIGRLAISKGFPCPQRDYSNLVPMLFSLSSRNDTVHDENALRGHAQSFELQIRVVMWSNVAETEHKMTEHEETGKTIDIHQKSSFLFILSGAKKKKVKVVSNSIQPLSTASTFRITSKVLTSRGEHSRPWQRQP
jgi:hypothetical protein